MSSSGREGFPLEPKSNVNERVLQFDESPQRPRLDDVPIFKPHREASTIELFYDLFFVANLTVFTKNHEINSGHALTSYMGFFTLMWFTWLQTSLFDVRFSTDSFINRVFKSISFGIMTGFAIVSSQYEPSLLTADTLNNTAPAFRAMALVLMVSRLALAAQYSLVFWYVRKYRKTKTPLTSSIAVLFLTSMFFLGTYFGFPGDANNPAASNDGIYFGWYAVMLFEALAMIAISCVWRVVSFRHTHLVERTGLLTLIIMGEGIIGLGTSVSTILQNSVFVASSAIGTIIGGVLLIYFIWVLYFDQIEHDRFGTIRQQFWALLHYPLHVGILLTAQGSTMLIIWNEIVLNLYWMTDNLWGPSYFATSQEYASSFLTNLTDFDSRFKTKFLSSSYNYTEAAANITHFNLSTTEDFNHVNDIYNEMYTKVAVFLFDNFNVAVPADAQTPGMSETDRLQALTSIFLTVFLYFLISAGCLLLVLAIMYWFGKKNKSRWEYASIALRAVVGVGLSLVSISYLYSTGFNLFLSPWMIPMVMIIYFIVITIDNLLVWHSNKTLAHTIEYQRSRSEDHINQSDVRIDHSQGSSA